MSNLVYLSDPEGPEPALVDTWDNDQGILIEAPGCGTAVLTNEEAMELLRWLNKRYVLDRMADV